MPLFLQSKIALQVAGTTFRGNATSAETLAKKFKSHLASGLYQLLATDASHISSAALLTRRFSLAIKSPDAVHLSLVQQKTCDLVTSDKLPSPHIFFIKESKYNKHDTRKKCIGRDEGK